MNRFAQILLLSLVPLLVASTSLAQSNQQTTINSMDETGTHPFGAYDGVKEEISLSTGNLHLEIPLLTFPGRGMNFTLAGVYDSKGAMPAFFKFFNDQYTIYWAGESRGPAIGPLGLSVPSLGVTQSVCSSNSLRFDWIFIDANGTQHHFGTTWGSCTAPFATLIDSDDSALIRLDTTNQSDFVVRMKDGTSVHFAGGFSYLGTGGTKHVFTSIVDTNGNTIQSTLSNGVLSSITDTVGRVYSFDFTNNKITYKDANGVQQTITFTKLTDNSGGSITYNHPTATDCTGGTFNLGAHSFPGPNTAWAMTIPNGGSGLTYQFEFDAVGELIKITYPSGGYTKYDFAPLIASYVLPASSISCSQVDFREVVAKHECRRSDGNCGPSPAPTPEDTTTYVATTSTEANATMDVFRPDPSGTPNKTHYVFSSPNPYAFNYASLELTRSVYSGSTTLLRTVQTDYTQINSAYYDASLPIRVTTTLNDITPNLVSKVETDYDTALQYNKFQSNTPIPITNPIEFREFDYGLVLKRKTDTTWLKTGEYAQDQKHILDRRTQSSAYDGSGNLAAQVNYEYDNYTEGLTASNATQHVSEDNYRGNLTATSKWLNTNGLLYTTRNQYDDAGNIRKVSDPLLHATTTSFTDSWQDSTCAPSSGQAAAYPTSITNALGQVTTRKYLSCGGLMASQTDPNLQTTTYTYDTLGRRSSISYPDGGVTSWTYNDVPPVSRTQTRKKDSTTNITITQVRDGLGRLAQGQLTSDPEGTGYVDIAYDVVGRKASDSNPHRSGSSSTDGTTNYQYDPLNRLVSVTKQDGSVARTQYCGNGVLTTDEAGYWRRSINDALGRLIEVDEPTSSSSTPSACPGAGGPVYVTTYGYDTLDDLISVVQNGSRQRTFTYNSLSQLTASTNPETGTVTLTYDSAGNISTKVAPAPNQTGSATITTTYQYDAGNRLTQRSYSDGTTPTASFTYDISSLRGVTIQNSVGRLVTADTSWASGSTYIMRSYDPLGRVLTQWQWFPARAAQASYAFSVNAQYNLAGLPTGFSNEQNWFYPAYDTAGRPTGLTSNDPQHPATLVTVDSTFGYYPTGALHKVTLGNGLTQTTALNSALQPCRINVNSSAATISTCTDPIPSGNVQDFNYGFNFGSSDNGDVACWTATGQQAFNRAYTYDSLNRLATLNQSGGNATGCSSNFSLSWTYDAWGNRTDQSVTSGTCNAFHATVNSQNQLSGSPYLYDAAGNMTNDGNHTYTYDGENRLISVDSGNTASYIYDAEGHRVQKTVGGTTTAFVLDIITGQVIEETSGSDTLQVGYVYFDGQLIGQFKPSATYFVHPDHLGSTRLVTDVNQTPVQNLDYLPFGELNSNDSGVITHKFTGKERDSESGLDNFGARYNSSRLGRFMTPDSKQLWAHLTDPQTLNRYSYTRNNPLVYVDPDGKDLGKAWNDVKTFFQSFTIKVSPCICVEAKGEIGKVEGKVGAAAKITFETSTAPEAPALTISRSSEIGVEAGPTKGPKAGESIETSQKLVKVNSITDIDTRPEVPEVKVVDSLGGHGTKVSGDNESIGVGVGLGLVLGAEGSVEVKREGLGALKDAFKELKDSLKNPGPPTTPPPPTSNCPAGLGQPGGACLNQGARGPDLMSYPVFK